MSGLPHRSIVALALAVVIGLAIVLFRTLNVPAQVVMFGLLHPENSESGITLVANQDNLVTCVGNGTFPLMDSSYAQDPNVALMIYEYTGHEPSVKGQYYLSTAQRFITPNASPATLTIFQRGKIYDIRPTQTLIFRCGTGIGRVPQSSASSVSSRSSSACPTHCDAQAGCSFPSITRDVNGCVLSCGPMSCASSSFSSSSAATVACDSLETRPGPFPANNYGFLVTIHNPETGVTYMFNKTRQMYVYENGSVSARLYDSNVSGWVEADAGVAATGTNALYLLGRGGIYRYDIGANTMRLATVGSEGRYYGYLAGARAVWNPINRKVYFFGGYGNGSFLNTILMFDVGTGTATVSSVTLPLPLSASAVVWDAGRNKILVIGGFEGNSTGTGVWSTAVYEFDPASGTFVRIATLPAPLQYPSAVYDPVGQKVYIFSLGYNLVRLDPLNRSLWTSTAVPPNDNGYGFPVWDTTINKIILLNGLRNAVRQYNACPLSSVSSRSSSACPTHCDAQAGCSFPSITRDVNGCVLSCGPMVCGSSSRGSSVSSVGPQADLQISAFFVTQVPSPTTIYAESNALFAITVVNNGPLPAESRLTMAVPPMWTVNEANSTPGGSIQNGLFTLNVEARNPGSSVGERANFNTGRTPCGSVVRLQATIAPRGVIVDPNPANNQSTVMTLTVICLASSSSSIAPQSSVSSGVGSSSSISSGSSVSSVSSRSSSACQTHCDAQAGCSFPSITRDVNGCVLSCGPMSCASSSFSSSSAATVACDSLETRPATFPTNNYGILVTIHNPETGVTYMFNKTRQMYVYENGSVSARLYNSNVPGWVEVDAGVAATGTNALYLLGRGGAIYRYDIGANTMRLASVVGQTRYFGYLAGARAVWNPIDRKVYFFGGYGNGSFLNTILTFDVASGTRSLSAAILPLPLSASAVVWDAGRNKILVIGGYEGNSTGTGVWSTAVYEFDPALNTLTRVASLPTALSHPSAVYDPFLQKIYIFSAGNNLVRFNPQNRTFITSTAVVPNENGYFFPVWNTTTNKTLLFNSIRNIVRQYNACPL